MNEKIKRKGIITRIVYLSSMHVVYLHTGEACEKIKLQKSKELNLEQGKLYELVTEKGMRGERVVSYSMIDDKQKKKIEKLIRNNSPLFLERKQYEKFLQFSALKAIYDDITKMFEQLHECLLYHKQCIVRYNADCDGYVAGVLVEYVLRKMRREKFYRYDGSIRRIPSRTPFYHMDDCLRDINSALAEGGRTCIIQVDQGSAEENKIAYELAQAHEIEVLIFDHHHTSSKMKKYTQVNPYQEGGTNTICTAVLVYKVFAAWLEEVSLEPVVASSIVDYTMGKEYKALLKKSEYTEESLRVIGEFFDYNASLGNYGESFAYVRNVVLETKKYSKIIDAFKKYYAKQEKVVKKIIEKGMQVHEVKKKVVGELEAKAFFKNHYFSPSKISNYAAKLLAEKHKQFVSLLYLDDMIIMRISDKSKVTVQDILGVLQKKLGKTVIHGGGHARAGSIRCPSIYMDEVKEIIHNYLEI